MRALLVALAAVVLTGCGSVGDPLPPALNVPNAVADLAAVQRGDTIVVSFTAPARTTEDLPIRAFDAVEVRVLAPSGETVLPAPDAQPGKPVEVRVDAGKWAGQEVAVSARAKGRRGRQSEWSPAVTLNARAPLPRPDVKIAADPAGIRLQWESAAGASYRITRAEESAEPVAAGTVDKPEFVDTAVFLGRKYTYTVQAFIGNVESLPSTPVTLVAVDTFPPAAPRGLTAVAGEKSVALLWERNTEADLAGYRVYRAEGSGNFAVLVDSVAEVSLTDRQVTSGTWYRYRVTALDKSGNESGPAEATVPPLP